MARVAGGNLVSGITPGRAVDLFSPRADVSRLLMYHFERP